MLLRKLSIPVLALAVAMTPAFGRKKKLPRAPAPAIEQMSADEKALHALNRLAFGPKPGDVEMVGKEGVDRWIEQQLHPDSIAENTALEAKLAPLDTLRMGTDELARKYPPGPQIKAMVEGKQPWPTDPETRMVVQRLADKYRVKLGLPEGDKDAPTFDTVLAQMTPGDQKTLRNGKPEEKIALLETLPFDRQYDVLTTMPGGQRLKLMSIASPQLRRKVQKMSFGPQQVVNQDLQDAKILRAVYSNRQLEQVLTDFWYNHFNVFLDKGADKFMVTSYERDAIRPFVLGKFKDLLLATAQSPAMLFYLDNYQSVGPDSQQRPNAKAAKKGLNENYGRELMELHTLGVDGGYTQQDVTEVARCFTGWTIRQPQRGGGFEFNEKQHDKGEKHVLGVTIRAGGGMEDGLTVLDILAKHPSTARFIAKSLATRFVADAPPDSLVDRMAATFTKTDGDLRQVMETMVRSPEFWAKDAYRGKIKSPFEMVVSSLRATNADIDFSFALAGQLNQLGEPLYRKQEPTGYSNRGSEWMNSAALLGRMNFALNLTTNKVAGVTAEVVESSDPDVVARGLLMTEMTAQSRDVVQKGLAERSATNQTPSAGLLAGLTLGSPDFQRR